MEKNLCFSDPALWTLDFSEELLKKAACDLLVRLSLTCSCVKSVPLSCMFVLRQAGGSTGLLMDLAASEKAVHADFFNGKDSCAFFTACRALPSKLWGLNPALKS